MCRNSWVWSMSIDPILFFISIKQTEDGAVGKAWTLILLRQLSGSRDKIKILKMCKLLLKYLSKFIFNA